MSSETLTEEFMGVDDVVPKKKSISFGKQRLPSIRDLDIRGRKVFMRLDLNVPMQDGKITSDARIVAALPTIKYAIEEGAI